MVMLIRDKKKKRLSRLVGENSGSSKGCGRTREGPAKPARRRPFRYRAIPTSTAHRPMWPRRQCAFWKDTRKGCFIRNCSRHPEAAVFDPGVVSTSHRRRAGDTWLETTEGQQSFPCVCRPARRDGWSVAHSFSACETRMKQRQDQRAWPGGRSRYAEMRPQ